MEEFCPYCGRTADEMTKHPGFSDEHVVPESFTGKIENNPFVIRTHEYCNNLAGMFMDGPAIRSWLINNEINVRASDYVNIEENPILPCLYMGVLKNVKHQGKICEVWLGPTGDHVYHLHDKYPDDKEMPAIVGVPPWFKKRKNEIDPGFAILFLTTNNPVWYDTVLRAFYHQFTESTLYLGNLNIPPSAIFGEMPNDIAELSKKLGRKKVHNVQNTMSVDADHRFLAKLGLGLGVKFLGDKFINSSSYITLKNFMWARTKEERHKHSFSGNSFMQPYDDKEKITAIFGWEGGHTVTLHNSENFVTIFYVLYQKFSCYVKIKKDGNDYFDEIGEGFTFIVAPGYKKVIGPVSYSLFQQYKIVGHGIPDLEEIEHKMRRYKKPPFKI